MSQFTSFRYLVALHREKHFGRAADACHITQPALSNAIRALETEFGTAIVKRGRAFESFTPEGERIFLSAQRILHERELLLQELKGNSDHPVGVLKLGAVPSVMPIAARFAGHLHARYPGLLLTVRSMSSPEIETGLENLSVDIGLGYTDRIGSRSTKLNTVSQYTERYFLLRRATKPAKSGMRILSRAASWEAASKLPLCLLTPEMHNRTIVDATFKQIGARVRPVIETNSILTLGLTVLVGEVCSILPGALVSVLRGYGELEAVPLEGPDVQTPIGFMLANSDRLSNAMRATLSLSTDPDWLNHLQAHVGLLKPGIVCRPN
jgi:DNA-binding transcriptional LysR family regulator